MAYDLENNYQKDEILEFYTKSNEVIKVNSNISMENFNNQKSIVIIGEKNEDKPYNMDMLEDLLDNIDVAAFIIDKNGKYLYVNNNFSEMLNEKRENIIGKYNNIYWDDETYNNFNKNNSEVFKNKSAKIFNEKAIIDGSPCWYKSFKAPIFDEDGNTKYIVATTRNVNLSKTISEELYKNYNRAIMENNFERKNKNMKLNDILNNIS